MWVVRALGRWISQGALVMWGAVTLAFLLLKAVPGDPVDTILGTSASVPAETRQALRTDLGLDLPLWQQYLAALVRPLTGDFGVSYRARRPVLDLLASHALPTLWLTLAALALALGLAYLLAAVTRRGVSRRVADVVELVAISSPTFWIALALAQWFAYRLKWLPVTGGNEATRLILPAIALAIPMAGYFAQLLRDGLDRAEREPFAETARARGLSRGGLFARHTLRHSSASLLTVVAFSLGGLLGGTVLVENVFARQGLGRVTLDAIINRDLPVVLAVTMLSALVFVVVNALVDLIAMFVDPRLRTIEGRRRSVREAAETVDPVRTAAA